MLAGLDRAKPGWKTTTFNGLCQSKMFGVRTSLGGRTVRAPRAEWGERELCEEAFLRPTLARLNGEDVRSVLFRVSTASSVRTWAPNECNANRYLEPQGHHLTPHFDDRQLSGPVLANLSLGGHCAMTYTQGHGKSAASVEVKVALPPRTLQLVTGEARYNWMHSIDHDDLASDQRTSITFREAVCPWPKH